MLFFVFSLSIGYPCFVKSNLFFLIPHVFFSGAVADFFAFLF